MITLLSLFPQMNKNDLTEFRTPYLWEKTPVKYTHLAGDCSFRKKSSKSIVISG